MILDLPSRVVGAMLKKKMKKKEKENVWFSKA